MDWNSKGGFYGLTDMPAKLQRAMDYTLMDIRKIFAFVDDI